MLELLALESGDALVFFHEGVEFFLAHHVFDAPERLVACALVHDAQDDVGRDRAACEHDFVRGLEPRVFIRPERGDAVALARKAPGERACVEDPLGGAVRSARMHRMGRIADERDPAEGPARKRVAVHHRILEHDFRIPEHFRDVQPFEAEALEGGEEIVEPAVQIPVRLDVAWRADLGGPVDELAALRIELLPARIDDDLADVEPPALNEALAAEIRLPARDAAPHVDARVYGRSLIRVELLAHGRMNRSEEHTSELQSHLNLVCRLLLEKKKQTKTKQLLRKTAKAIHS